MSPAFSSSERPREPWQVQSERLMGALALRSCALHDGPELLRRVLVSGRGRSVLDLQRRAGIGRVAISAGILRHVDVARARSSAVAVLPGIASERRAGVGGPRAARD